MNREVSLYPLKFVPSFHYRIWGGNSLKDKFNKKITKEKIGESWEISDVEEFESIVAEGELKGKTLKELIQLYKADLLGTSVFERYGINFPVLVKLIDTEEKLSVQVHPDDDFAKKHHDSFGKNEMWYVLDVKEDSEITIGFKEGVTKEIFLQHLKSETLETILRTVKPKIGDVFFIPAGRVHAIGKNIVLAEIQQTSDITYRIYDYNRIDKDGKKRELHTNLAIQVSDFNYIREVSTRYEDDKNKLITLENNPYFFAQKLILTKKIDLVFDNSSFIVLMQIKGESKITCDEKVYLLNLGETILIPAKKSHFSIESQAEVELLVVRMGKSH
ncbi:MAG: class I mannose-6-phosphate isomerase [Flavobacteriales bacterium]|nr:class I mannose-6-phosphate isomerase [Flavobacteriales bacterium]